MKYLARFFFVVVVNEHNSSKKCPVCETDMTLIPNQKGYRLWQCAGSCSREDGELPFVVNKDKSAGVCFMKILFGLVVNGVRPVNF